jgi:cytochrome c-type biogenesis protein CcmH/NrfF
MDKVKLEILNSINPESLNNPDFGKYKFENIRPKFEDILSMIREMVQADNESLPIGIRQRIGPYIDQLNGQYKRFTGFSIDRNPADTHARITRDFESWYNLKIIGGNNNQPDNFITIYNFIKSQQRVSIDESVKNVKNLSNQAMKDSDSIAKILNQLQKKTQENIVEDYARVFKSQAEKYSNFRLLKEWPPIQLGQAQLWLLAGIILAISFIPLVGIVLDLFSISITESIQIKVINGITRLVFISFLLILLNFFFRQFSISKHLYTVNKHRQNTLDSYQLFLSTIDEEDKETRNTLMLEVAKTIYDVGNTGYISSKQTQTFPSVTNMTRILQGTEN